MGRPLYVLVELGKDDQLWIDLRDFEGLNVGMVAKGGNIYHEFAKRKLKYMGVPELLVEMANYSIQPDW